MSRNAKLILKENKSKFHKHKPLIYCYNFKITKNNKKMKKYRCEVCDWIYDPEVGDPDGGIAPGTPFEDIPDDWKCPVCGVGKEDFVVEE